jgi:hypothetical protein
MRNIKSVLFILAISTILTGCLTKSDKPIVAPTTVYWEERLDVNKFVTLSGEFAPGNAGTQETPFDLNFYFVDSSEVIGVKGGFFEGENVRCYIKFMDLGPLKFEAVDEAVKIDAPNGYYHNIKTERVYSDDPAGNTLFQLNHVYLLYKWSKWGGNYMKMLVSEIDTVNNSVFIRGIYQKRPGYLFFEWPI